MNKTVQALLEGRGGNHILPFFWQHGEDEATLREYMGVIQNSGCGAVCVESRPHPDYCGPKWWEDMDVILDEARKRGMKVWILDDSHFPTGYANGAMEDAPAELCRQSVCAARTDVEAGTEDLELDVMSLIPAPFTPIGMEAFILPSMPTPRHYDDDTLLTVTAVERATGKTLDLTGNVQEGTLRWKNPGGAWTLWTVGLSRNCGPHRSYINMMDKESCHKLIEAVYEPHWEHYSADFGKTIAGFFSDEPELGNGHMYFMENLLGTDQDLPFSRELPGELEQRLGAGWAGRLYLLWDNDGDAAETARVRYAYMDAVTKCVREDFSRQLGDWCRAHGVLYIGHLIEDDNAHARTGSSLGHYFRGLDGQDMAGIDVISQQVMPQQTGPYMTAIQGEKDGEFYYYVLPKLAPSAAAIEPRKRGRAMCELFGAYGWSEGVRLEKYLVDHLMVRGVNEFVPHAFSPLAFPDPDCPPHFYAHGHNPQYRHFGRLMRYTNRAAELLTSGPRTARVAVLYHGEAEWAGKRMLCQKPIKVLTEAQIDCDIIPCDVFAEPELYGTRLEDGLEINGRKYEALVIPYGQFVPAALADGVERLRNTGTQVLFLEGLPEGICDGPAEKAEVFRGCEVLAVDELAEKLCKLKTAGFAPADPWLRVMRVEGDTPVYFFTNEGAEPWTGEIALKEEGPCYGYDAYGNRVFALDAAAKDGGTVVRTTLLPLHSLAVIFGEAEGLQPLPRPAGEAVALTQWERSVCEGAEYPDFGGKKEVGLPDRLAEEQPEFSGFVRYETTVELLPGQKVFLEIEDAAEGVEVFLNGKSAGIQIVPPFRYELTELVQPGENRLVIEVATTLERQCYDPNSRMPSPPPTSKSGLIGSVKLMVE